MTDPAFQEQVLTTRDGRVALSVVPFGLTVHRLELRPHDAPVDVLVGPEEAKSHADGRAFFGSAVGRYANRLRAGKHEAGGKEFYLPEWGAPGVSHHGGPARAQRAQRDMSLEQHGPFDQVYWTRLDDAASMLYKPEEYSMLDAHAVYAIESPNGDQGYPGRLRVEALIGVSSAGEDADEFMEMALGRCLGQAHVEYRAVLLDETVATPVNLAQHWGFNLAAAAKGGVKENTIDEHQLRLTGQAGSPIRRLALDAAGVSTGELLLCSDPEHDWTKGKRIAADMPGGGYDHYYLWGSKAVRSKPKVVLRSPSTGLALVFRTNQPGVQLYTANGQPAREALAGADPAAAGGVRKVVHRGEGEEAFANEQRSAAFLEFSAPHGTFVHESLQGEDVAGGDTLLRPGQMYCSWVNIAACAEN